MNKLLIFLYVLWFVLNMADIGLTQCALSHGCLEVNPIARWIIGYGWTIEWIFKISLSLVFIGILQCFNKDELKFKLTISLIGCLVFLTVVSLNIFTLYDCLADGR